MDSDGYYFYLAGANRANETLKFFLAISKSGLPVYLYKADIFKRRMQGTEKIGVVPSNIIPKYRSGDFPGEDIISFMNLPIENPERVASKCVWQDIKEVKLISEED